MKLTITVILDESETALPMHAQAVIALGQVIAKFPTHPAPYDGRQIRDREHHPIGEWYISPSEQPDTQAANDKVISVLEQKGRGLPVDEATLTEIKGEGWSISVLGDTDRIDG